MKDLQFTLIIYNYYTTLKYISDLQIHKGLQLQTLTSLCSSIRLICLAYILKIILSEL